MRGPSETLRERPSKWQPGLSEAIRGDQRPSVTHVGAIDNQGQSRAIKGNQGQSMAINGNQKQSRTINGNQGPSGRQSTLEPPFARASSIKIAPIRRRACARCSRVLSSTEWSRHNCVIKRHQASSGVIKRHQASSGVIRRHQWSSEWSRHNCAACGRHAVVSACMRAFGVSPETN